MSSLRCPSIRDHSWPPLTATLAALAKCAVQTVFVAGQSRYFGEGALDEKSLAERDLPCHYWAGIGRTK